MRTMIWKALPPSKAKFLLLTIMVFSVAVMIYSSSAINGLTIVPPKYETSQLRPLSSNIRHRKSDVNKSSYQEQSSDSSNITSVPMLVGRGNPTLSTQSSNKDRAEDREKTPFRELKANTALDQDNVCQKIKIMPKRSLPVIALASLPGSGNTWLRYLIERVTGIYTGSVYDDRQLMKGDFVGEGYRPYTGQTVAVKMHVIKQPRKINRTILLVRDLYDAIISDFNRMSGGGEAQLHTHVVNESLYRSKEWPKCVQHMVELWRQLIDKATSNFANKGRLLVVHYQDLKDDLPNQLRRLVEFLGLPLDGQRLKCTLERSDGSFRRHSHTLTFNPFDENQTSLVENAIKDAQRAMEDYQLPPLRFERYGRL